MHKQKPLLTRSALDVVSQLDQAETKESCIKVLDRFLQEHGIQHFMIAEFTGPVEPDVMREGKFPAEWFERYLTKNYEYSDPVTKSLMGGSGEDVIWGKMRLGSKRGSKGWTILNEGREFGLADGITIPIIGPNGYLAGATFAAPSFDDDPDFQAALSLVATYVHAKLLRFHDRKPTMSYEALTAREREVLEWAAAGKTDWEVGEILCISETTAKRHIENAKQKLGASKRIQAIVTALKSRQIRV